MQDHVEPFIATSYHFDGDRSFVDALCRGLANQGIRVWFLDYLMEPKGFSTYDVLGAKRDWRLVPGNWQGTFVEHLLNARGVIVVFSAAAQTSYSMTGRGMWRERPAIDFVRRDNPLRVREVERPRTGDTVPGELLADLAGWGRRVLALPPVARTSMTSMEATEFNIATGESGAQQLPERKPPSDAWYELVRVDLYDVLWLCRSCGLSSVGFEMAAYDPPLRCPRCGFERQPS